MSDQRQKSIVRHTCERCFKTWRQKESFLKHLENCKGDGSAPEYRCDKCLRTFAYGRSFRNHECKGLSRINTCRFCNKNFIRQAYLDKHVKICGKRSTSNNDPAPQPSQMKTCPFCKRNYVRRVCFDKHVEICGKRDRWLTSMGFRKEEIPSTAPRNPSSNPNRFGYVCVKCGCRFKKLAVSKIAFHRCSNKMLKVKRNMNRYTNLYTKVVLDKTRISRRKLEGRICHNCKKVFPSKEMCFNHYSRKLCKKSKPARKNQQQQHHYYKCNICGAYYEMHSILQRHMREHVYMKRIRKKMGLLGGRYNAQLRGGGSPSRRRANKHPVTQNNDDDAIPGPSTRRESPSSSDDDQNDDVPLMHLTRDEPVLPARWGWTTHVLTLNTSNFDSELLARLMLAEIKSEISERKRVIQNEHNDADGNNSSNESPDDELVENDERFSTLSMIAILKVYFYKLDLGASLGKNNQTTKVRRKHSVGSSGEHDDDETLVDAYFHSSPIRLLSGNLKEEIHFIVDNFKQQVEEYTTLKSGLKLFRVNQCELNFYTYKSLAGGSEEAIPPHCHMTLHALYLGGKILDISYQNIKSRIMELGENVDVYTDNCFMHVLAAYIYLEKGFLSKTIPICVDGSTGYILEKYTQVHVTDLMKEEEVKTSLKRFDFSMCANRGRPMLLEDTGKFYRENYARDKTIPIINIFKLDYVDGINDVMLPNGVDTLGEKNNRRVNKYVVTHYFLGRDFDDESSSERGVINVLYWKETEHYYLIANLKALVLNVNFNNSIDVRFYQKLCYVCLNLVDVRYIEMKDHVDLCRARNHKQHIRYPTEGKNIESFTNFRLMNKLQFYVSADAECTLLPIVEPDRKFLGDEYGSGEDKELNRKINQTMYENAYRSQNFPYKGGTSANTPRQVHRLNSIGWKLHVDDEISRFPREDFIEQFGGFSQIVVARDDSLDEEERLIDQFMDWLNKATEFIRNWVKEMNNKTVQMKALERLKREHKELMEKSTHCIYCKNKLVEPCLDHCHLTLKARGMSCNDCNLQARMPSWRNFKLQIYFHNFAKYDSCFISKYMKRPILSKRRRKEHVWRCRMRGNKIHQIKTHLLDFRDSLDLFPLSIASLSTNLPPDQMTNVNEIKWSDEDVSKNIYPYEWLTSVKLFNDIPFPSIDKFESSLAGKVSSKDYNYSKQLYEKHCTMFLDWHVHYLELDVNILMDSLSYWQNVIFKEFGIDLLQCHSLPSCAKQSMLKMSRVRLQLITDPTMHNLFQSNIRGGLCVTALRSREIRDQTKESIRYFDVKSLYASVQKLYRHPVDGFRFLMPVPSPEVLHEMVLEYDEKSADTGYLCVVDLKIPKKLHWMLSDFPVTYQKMSVDPCLYPPTSKWHHLPKSKTPKLIPSLFDPKNYGVSMMTLKFLVRLGLVIEKVHRVVAYNQEYFLRDFVDICLQKRKESGLKMDDVTFKLIANGLFGKFIENAFLYTDTKFVFDKSDYERIVRDGTRFVSAKFEKYGVFMQSKLSTVKMDKAIAVGFSILCKSKSHFQEMYYFKILPSYIKVCRPLTPQNRIRVMYVDTDSMILYLSLDLEREMEFYSLLSDIFDFSTLPKNDRFYSVANKSVVGIFKDEVNGLLIRSQHSNGAKSYLYTIENNTGLDERLMNERERGIYYPRIRMKSLSRFFQSTQLREEDFVSTFLDPDQQRRLTYSALRIGPDRKMFTFTCTKKILDCHDSKRWVYPCQRDSIALGHYLTLDSSWVQRVLKVKDGKKT